MPKKFVNYYIYAEDEKAVQGSVWFVVTALARGYVSELTADDDFL